MVSSVATTSCVVACLRLVMTPTINSNSSESPLANCYFKFTTVLYDNFCPFKNAWEVCQILFLNRLFLIDVSIKSDLHVFALEMIKKIWIRSWYRWELVMSLFHFKMKGPFKTTRSTRIQSNEIRGYTLPELKNTIYRNWRIQATETKGYNLMKLENKNYRN